MSKQSNPTLIGAFVVGAMLLLAGGVALFGGSELLVSRMQFVAYFTENTKGLREGSNVLVNGVRVGHVKRVALIVDEVSFESVAEVTMELLPDDFHIARSGVVVGQGIRTSVPHEALVNEGGLRAKLGVESLLTGQLLIELGFRPDLPPVMRGGDDPPYPEIPTIPSEIQEFLQKVQGWIAMMGENFDAKEIGQRMNSILRGIDELVNSQHIRDALAGLDQVINDQNTQQMPASLQATLKELEGAAADAGRLFRNTDATIESLRADLRPVIERIVAALDEARLTLAAAKAQLNGESAETYQLTETLEEVEAAARALREFLDYLERNPEAVIKGKKG